jgi:hypothetical protein
MIKKPEKTKEEVDARFVPVPVQVILAKQAEQRRLSEQRKQMLLDNVEALEKRVRGTIPNKDWIIPREKREYAHLRLTPHQMFYGALRYFRKQIKNEQPITLSGTAISLGFSKYTLWNTNGNVYKEEYSFVPLLKTFVEETIEVSMVTSINPAADMFRLKNLGWQDKIEIATTSVSSLSVEEREASQRRIQSFTENIAEVTKE